MKHFNRYIFSILLFAIITMGMIPIVKMIFFFSLLLVNVIMDMVYEYHRQCRRQRKYANMKFRVAKSNEYGMGYCGCCYVR